MTDYLPEVFAIDPKDGKTKFRFDETTELKIDDFLSQVELEGYFTKIADAHNKPKKRFIRNPEVNPIKYAVVDGLFDRYKEYKDVVYIITFNGYIVKIGGTYTGMKKRHTSYNCGARKARDRGTCSVTNYHCTEAQYTALRDGKKVEWYVFDVPTQEVTANIWNKDRKVSPKLYTFYEADLCQMYAEKTGHFPRLSKNAGVE